MEQGSLCVVPSVSESSERRTRLRLSCFHGTHHQLQETECSNYPELVNNSEEALKDKLEQRFLFGHLCQQLCSEKQRNLFLGDVWFCCLHFFGHIKIETVSWLPIKMMYLLITWLINYISRKICSITMINNNNLWILIYVLTSFKMDCWLAC